eukprot:251381-Rhodomonas_salina.3
METQSGMRSDGGVPCFSTGYRTAKAQVDILPGVTGPPHEPQALTTLMLASRGRLLSTEL